MDAQATFSVSVPDSAVRHAAGTDALEARVAALEAQVASILSPEPVVGEPVIEPTPEPVPEPAPSTDVLFRSRWETGEPLEGGKWQA